MRILVVEDEPRMAALLAQTLREEGHLVVATSDGRDGLEIARSATFDVIVLDVMLPSMDGTTIARKLREGRNQTPLLMLTGRDAPADVVRGLDSGADDYLAKPFAIDVFLARIRSVSRRGVIPRPVILKIADLKLDPASHVVTRAENPSASRRVNTPCSNCCCGTVAALSAAMRSWNRYGASIATSRSIALKSLCACCVSRSTHTNRS